MQLHSLFMHYLFNNTVKQLRIFSFNESLQMAVPKVMVLDQDQ